MNIYYGSPTSGGVDGTAASQGTQLTPVTMGPLSTAGNEEGAAVKLAVRCDDGYVASAGATITPTSPATTLSAGAAVGATTISVVSATGLSVGNSIAIGSGWTLETKNITIISGLTLTLDTALANIQASGAAVVGQSKLKWALAPDNAGVPGTFEAYGAALTFADPIPDTNVLFWAKAKATSDEPPINDISVKLVISATVGAE